jgi:hypothetical protein
MSGTDSGLWMRWGTEYCELSTDQSSQFEGGPNINTILQFELRQYREQVVDGISALTRKQAESIVVAENGLSALLGGLYYMETELGYVAADVARLATMADWALPKIVGLLANTADRLGTIEQMLSSPNETAAAERYRTGTRALVKAQNAGSPAQTEQWYALAARDLQQAVSFHPYHPKTWYHLGVALDRQGLTVEAADAFAQCVFFGIDESLELGATAGLLSAALYRQAGLGDKSSDTLREYLPQLDQCAELHLALGAHHGDYGELRRALEIAPFLAADARAAGVENLEGVAEDLCRHPEEPVQRLRRLEDAIRVLVHAVTPFGLENVSASLNTTTLPLHGVDALLLSSAALPAALEVAKQSMREVDRAMHQLGVVAELSMVRIEQVRLEGVTQVSQTEHRYTAETQRIEEEVLEVRERVLRSWQLIEWNRDEARKASHPHDAAAGQRVESLYQDVMSFVRQLPADRPWLRFAAEGIRLEQQVERGRRELLRAEYEERGLRYGSGADDALWRVATAQRTASRSSWALENHQREAPEMWRQQEEFYSPAKLALKLAGVGALQQAQQEAELALADAKRAAETAADRLRQARLAVGEPMRELQAIITSIPLIERIIPFDLPGYLTG